MSLKGLVAKKGAAVTFTASTPGTYDPLTEIVTGSSVVTVTGHAVEVDGDPDLYKALGLIESFSPTLLFVPDAGVLPRVGASVVWGGDTFQVKNLKRLAMAGVPTAARIVVVR